MRVIESLGDENPANKRGKNKSLWSRMEKGGCRR